MIPSSRAKQVPVLVIVRYTGTQSVTWSETLWWFVMWCEQKKKEKMKKKKKKKRGGRRFLHWQRGRLGELSHSVFTQLSKHVSRRPDGRLTFTTSALLNWLCHYASNARKRPAVTQNSSFLPQQWASPFQYCEQRWAFHPRPSRDPLIPVTHPHLVTHMTYLIHWPTNPDAWSFVLKYRQI